jgi:hypothetical protein
MGRIEQRSTIVVNQSLFAIAWNRDFVNVEQSCLPFKEKEEFVSVISFLSHQSLTPKDANSLACEGNSFSANERAV